MASGTSDAKAPQAVRILASPEETDALGSRLADALMPGDVVALAGPLGAGKSALARSVIAARLAAAGRPPEAMPSPTYTLVQTYDAGPIQLTHADLYRLADPEEAEELGLLDPDPTTIRLIEWVERLGALLPARRLELTLSLPQRAQPQDIDSRRLTAFGVGSGWEAAIAAINETAP